jgi:hypothetical protein
MKQVRIQRSLTIEQGRLVADVTCWFPVEESEEGKDPDLCNILVNPERSIWGIPLTPRIGVVHEYWERYIYVQKSFPLAYESIAAAVEWVEQKTNEAAEVIRSVVEDYQKLEDALPSFATIFIDIP